MKKTKSIMASSCIIAIFNIILNSIFIKGFLVWLPPDIQHCVLCFICNNTLSACKAYIERKKRPCPFKTLLIWGPAGVVLFFAFLSSISYLFYG